MLPELTKELDNIIKKIVESKYSVKKLTELAGTMKKYKKELFTCVAKEGVATTNNKAEQKLRHFVLKRKNCFGTKTDKGNKTLEINMSVIMSLWWEYRDQFWQKFFQILTNSKI